MAWYWWVLIWAVLVLGASAVLGGLGLSLWRRAKLLFRELEVASERMSAVSDQFAKLQRPATEGQPPAVFTTASQLRQEQFLAARRRGATETRRKSVR